MLTPTRKNKTLREYRSLEVSSGDSIDQFYGTSYKHQEISLGVSDVYKIRAIYEAVPGTTTTVGSKQVATPPSFTLDVDSGNFDTGHFVKGQTSGVRAKLIDFNSGSRSYFYYLTDNKFTEGETVVDEIN